MLERLIELKYSLDCKKYPSMNPNYVPKTKYTDKTANGLTKYITNFLKLSGQQTKQINSIDRIIDKQIINTNYLSRQRTIGSLQYIKGNSTNGTADISATIKGRYVKIEVKIGADRQSEAQKKYESDVNKAGGVYVMAKDFDIFMEWYNNYIQSL